MNVNKVNKLFWRVIIELGWEVTSAIGVMSYESSDEPEEEKSERQRYLKFLQEIKDKCTEMEGM